MCGRYVNILTSDEIRKVFGIEHVPEFQAKFNQSPGSKSPIIQLDENGERKCTLMVWGLIPFWSKDGKVKFTNNARSETIRKTASYREPFKSRRCLIPVNGFYEWQKTATGKQPYYITLQSGGVMAFAGIFDRWKSPAGEIVESFAIATCDPNVMMARVHDRMPMILDETQWDEWLSLTTSLDRAESMLVPYDADLMRMQKVSTRVGNSRNEGPDLIQPIND